MDYPDTSVRAIGPFLGRLSETFDDDRIAQALSGIDALVASPNAAILSRGRNLNVRVSVQFENRELDLMAKRFGRNSVLKDRLDRIRGGKARRSWTVAEVLRNAGVGTPLPVGYLERWEGARLAESYYLSEFQDGVSSLKQELIHLFEENPQCERFMLLLQAVADAVRGMHDAGVLHNDLGNQNILLRRSAGGGWGDVQFIDLNRARLVHGGLSLRQRARDISRIYLPSDLLRVFIDMYFGEAPPSEFLVWEQRFRKAFAWHTRTRRFRHPIREWREARRSGRERSYPGEKDMWIWDERSGQAIVVLDSKDRHRYYPMFGHARAAGTLLSKAAPIYREYRAVLGRAFTEPVDMRDRIGMAVEPTPRTMDRELALLEGLGRIPVLVRLYRHDDAEMRTFRHDLVRRLRSMGYGVTVGLVQDRKSVCDPSLWRQFVEEALDAVGDCVEAVELGHAINRVKWGIWSADEYRALLKETAGLVSQYPRIGFVGPACIDFEYAFVVDALQRVPEPLRFSALSHHLYVDRRGAPENPQFIFSTLEKLALARAVARVSKGCDDRLIVSEVNWPLKGMGVYSPVGSPYVSPRPRHNDPSVDEELYADYMIRYLLIALCSGMADRVFWWRLVARGYGLVDDSNEDAWRLRPAYGALKTFIANAGDAMFTGKISVRDVSGKETKADGYCFGKDGCPACCLAYCSEGTVQTDLGAKYSRVTDLQGNAIAQDGHVSLTGSPVWFLADG